MSWADGAEASKNPILQKMSTAQAQELFNVSVCPHEKQRVAVTISQFFICIPGSLVIQTRV